MSSPERPQPELVIPHNTPPDVLNRLAEFRQNILEAPSNYHEAGMLIAEHLGATALHMVHESDPGTEHTNSVGKTLPPGVELARSKVEAMLEEGLGRYLHFDDHTENVVDADHDHEALVTKIAETRKRVGNSLPASRDRAFVTAIHASRLKIFTRELMLRKITSSTNQNQLAE